MDGTDLTIRQLSPPGARDAGGAGRQGAADSTAARSDPMPIRIMLTFAPGAASQPPACQIPGGFGAVRPAQWLRNQMKDISVPQRS